MCHSSSDVLARPRRPPPESSVESSAPESAKLFLRVAESCGVAHQSPPPSPVAVPARVVPTSPPKSSEALLESQQIRPPPESLHGVPTRVVQQAPPGSSGLRQSHPTSSPGSPALSESSAVIRRPCQSRPLSVPESGQECRSSSRPPRSSCPAVVHRCRQTRPPSSLPELPRMSRPRQTTVVRRARPRRPPSPPESPAKFLLKVCQLPASSGYRRLFFREKDDEACWLDGCGSESCRVPASC